MKQLRADDPLAASPFLRAECLTVRVGAKAVLKDLSFVMAKGEHWLLTGAAGVGKSTLGKALCRLLFFQGRLDISPRETELPDRVPALFVDQWYHFADHRGLTSQFYYQQRYNSQDDHTTVTVLEDLQRSGSWTEDDISRVLRSLGLEHRMDASLVMLSSGEQKKVQLARAFLSRPLLLVLDNPFTGLDEATCSNLDYLLADLVKGGTQLLLIGDPGRLPGVITHVATLRPTELSLIPRAAYRLIHPRQEEIRLPLADVFRALPLPTGEALAFSNFVRMEGVTVRYAEKIILDNISWTVKKGQRWWLKGPNGAGKSTLLSLMNGDNPQAYAHRIFLFDKRRGSGESIWDIKSKIGYISPELHWYFDPGATCPDAIASGFFDTTGLYRPLNKEQETQVEHWMEVFGLTPFNRHRFQDLSVGSQRMTLLARALVKDPPVLLLDEPCQGLDEAQAAHFTRVVDTVMEERGRTLIYVSHRTDQLPSCLDHVQSLVTGKQTEQGPFYHHSLTVPAKTHV